VGTDEVTEEALVELRRPTAQIVRSVLPWVVIVPCWLVLILQNTGSTPWRIAIAVLAVIGIVVNVVPQWQLVLRLSEDGVYEGRANGKKVALLGPGPLRLGWSDISDIRVVEGWKTRSVLLQARPYGQMLRYIPRTSALNPDPTFDERVALLRSVWHEHRVLPPPPLPPPPPS